jgi:sulfur carrier protein ThiS
MIYKMALMKINELKEHEEINPSHLKELMEKIKSDGILKKPIAVDKNTKIVLDGAHRLNALKALGCKKIPAVLVNYRSPKIKVLPWRKGEKIAKKDVIIAGLTGNKLPPKTSKHMVEVNGKLKHISFLQKRVNIPLEKLR